jgi:hypothetical protein
LTLFQVAGINRDKDESRFPEGLGWEKSGQAPPLSFTKELKTLVPQSAMDNLFAQPCVLADVGRNKFVAVRAENTVPHGFSDARTGSVHLSAAPGPWWDHFRIRPIVAI